MGRPVVGPDDDGRVLLKRSQAAWLMRVSSESVRRWMDEEHSLPVVGTGRAARVTWDDLCARAKKAGDPPPSHWQWLNEPLTDPPADKAEPAGSPSAAGEASSVEPTLELAEPERELVELRAENDNLKTKNADLQAELDIALAESENLDQAVMIFRENWRLRTQPSSPRGLMGPKA